MPAPVNATPEQFEHNGRSRRVVGRLHYPEPPTPDSIVGPNAFGEPCVILGTVGRDTLVGLADKHDIKAYVEGLAERP